MKIVADTDQKKNFFGKLEKVKTTEELIKEGIDFEDVEEELRKGRKVGSRATRRKFFVFDGKKTDYKDFAESFIAIENRLMLAKSRLQRISKECIVVETDESEIGKIRELAQKDTTITPDFLCDCEYFLFAVKSCLDIMSQILNDVYNLGIPKNKVSTASVYEKLKSNSETFAQYLTVSWDKWIELLNIIRNRMTHHIIVSMNTQVSHDIENKKIAYYKYVVSVDVDKWTTITKPLPMFFEETISNMDALLDEFYTKLNTIAV